METKDFKRTKGITLISLVVAIVVLLILTGISISLVIGDNGILTQSSSSVIKNREAKAKEEVQLAWSSAETKYYTDWAKNTSVNKDDYYGDEVLLSIYVADTGTVESSVKNSDGQTWTVKYRAKDQNQLYTFIIDEIGNIVNKKGGISLKSQTKLKKNQEEILEVILDGITGNVSWESSAPEVVSVTGNGTNATIKALGDTGSVVIKAKIAGTIYEATCTVTIVKKVTEISAEEIIVEEGKTKPIVVATIPTGDDVEDLIYTYESNNTATATVDSTGKVTGVAAGSTSITITGKNGDSETLSVSCAVTVQKPLSVGDTVEYKPTGKYDWSRTYATADETAVLKLQTIASGSVDSGYTNASVTSWKILSIDETTGKVEMVPAAINGSASVRLQGAPGYNNAVNLLNEACSSLYGNVSKEITARSINMEDIEGLFDKAGVDSNNDGILDWRYVRENYSIFKPQYDEQVSIAYTTYRKYPIIYEKEIKSVINEIEKSNGLGMNDKYMEENILTGEMEEKFIPRGYLGATNGYIQASTSIQPYQTYYYYGESLTGQGSYRKYLGAMANLLQPNPYCGYWIASRCVKCHGTNSNSYAKFMVRAVVNGCLDACLMIGSKTNEIQHGTSSLFPVVTLDSKLIEVKAGGGYEVK